VKRNASKFGCAAFLPNIMNKRACSSSPKAEENDTHIAYLTIFIHEELFYENIDF
jgi:hypothetical protein